MTFADLVHFANNGISLKARVDNVLHICKVYRLKEIWACYKSNKE